MNRYIFQQEVGKEITRLVLSDRLRELCSLPERFAPFERQARNLILAYLGAESLDEKIQEAVERIDSRPVFPLVLGSGTRESIIPDCPTGSLYRDRDGKVAVRQSSCIYCGRCTKQGFLAYARTGLIRSLEILKARGKITAIVAPSITGQFNASPAELERAMRQIGFDKIVNVAAGATTMAVNEGNELESCIKCSDWMITSCCASIKELGQKLLPVIEKKHSSARTPVEYTSALCREQEPDSRIIFIGPCLAKIAECSRNENVDGVLLFSELEMIFIAEGIVFNERNICTESEDLSVLSRTDGISNAVKKFCSIPASSMSISGIGKRELSLFSSWKDDFRPEADHVEIVCCPGGCISGPGNTARVIKS